jgi:hypothetical protein
LEDAEEYVALEYAWKLQYLGLYFELSGPRTSQRNGKVVEGKFQTI